ncbi:hypothetical protein [Persephonella sp.]
MKKLLMALAVLGFTTASIACPCQKALSGCPDCGKANISETDAYKGKEIKSVKPECEKCAKVEKSESEKE